jgi:phosphopantothenoylcysteine decarboxylase/phosphopantothenate--cysteine ligase
METQNIADYGRSKLTKKRVDMIVANEAKVAFGGDQNQATFITHGAEEALPAMPKLELAGLILDRASAFLDPSASASGTTSSGITGSRPAQRPRVPTPARPPKGRSRSKV